MDAKKKGGGDSGNQGVRTLLFFFVFPPSNCMRYKKNVHNLQKLASKIIFVDLILQQKYYTAYNCLQPKVGCFEKLLTLSYTHPDTGNTLGLPQTLPNFVYQVCCLESTPIWIFFTFDASQRTFQKNPTSGETILRQLMFQVTHSASF